MTRASTEEVAMARGGGRVLRLGLVFAVATLVYGVAYRIAFGSEDFQRYWAFSIEQALLFGCTAAFVGRAAMATSRRSRRFWLLIGLAHLFYLVTYLIGLAADWRAEVRAVALLAEHLLHLLYYGTVFLALIDKPHLPDETRPTSLCRWIEVGAGVVLLIAVAAYFVVIPVAHGPQDYPSYGPTMGLFGTMDAVLALYFLLLARDSSRSRWRLVYLLLAADSLIWTGLDFYEAAIFFELTPYEPGNAIDLIWLAPYVALLAAILATTDRHAVEHPSPRGAYHPELMRFSGGRLTVLCLVALPLTHFALNAFGSPNSAHGASRELIVLVFGAVLGILAILDDRIRHRERRLVTNRLHHAQKQEDLGRLAGYVAHDFRNVMTVVNGYSDLLIEESQDDDSMMRRVQKIREAGQDATRLTQQLLMFSRRIPLEPEALNLNGLVSALSNVLERVIAEDIELVVHTAPDLWTVHIDRSQMEHVLMNLVVNARDAMPEGGTLTVETRNEPASSDIEGRLRGGGKDSVAVAITDTGCGMDDEIRAQAFDPFFTTKEPGQGPGLGLSVALGIVERHGGHMRILSGEQTGTTVLIRLPRAEADAAGASPSPRAAASPSP